MVQVVTIPFDYEKLPASEREHVVPICIQLVDPSGQPIPMEWFEKAVAPV